MATTTIMTTTTTEATPKTTPKTYQTPKASKALKAPEDMTPQLHLITSSPKGTPFDKRVWTAICHIPRGSFTTYALLSKHLGTAPRAVGNALRRNPYAPGVPCHRVVATGGTLGGFKGKWPKSGEGINLDEKRKLLRGEGVRFGDDGKVVGSPWVFKG